MSVRPGRGILPLLCYQFVPQWGAIMREFFPSLHQHLSTLIFYPHQISFDLQYFSDTLIQDFIRLQDSQFHSCKHTMQHSVDPGSDLVNRLLISIINWLLSNSAGPTQAVASSEETS